MKIADYTVSGKKVVKLICVTENNNNKYYNFYEQSDGNFIAQYGRVKGTEVTHTYPISNWDKIYRSKIKKGYQDVTHLYTESVEKEIADANGDPIKITEIQNSLVKKLFDDLQAFANKTVQANYTVNQEDVTQTQVDEAQKIINEISKLMTKSTTKDELNKLLLKLYTVIPRKMKNVKENLLTGYVSSSDIDFAHKLIDDEQKLLDTMAGQVEMIRKKKEADKKSSENASQKQSTDILETLGLDVDEANNKEIDVIRKMMGPNAHQLKHAFKVINKSTERRFSENLKKQKNKKTEMFYHGSRNENWLNILQTGLLIRPSGAVHTGAMFSDGIYFADKAKKAIGYSSLRGSYWTGGSSNKGYLSIYEVHVGNQKHIYKHDSSCYHITKEKLNNDNYDSVFAHGGVDLINNEYIIYNPSQCTIRYIIELKN